MTLKNEYKEFIQNIKSKIQSAQIKAHVKVNEEMLRLYWEIAFMIVEKQKSASWGDGFIADISKDLQREFPSIKGFSKRNLELMRQWYRFYFDELLIAKQLVSQLQTPIEQQAVAQIDSLIFQIPWGHNLAIMSKSKNINEAIFYVNATIKNNYSRAVLLHQIESDLYSRSGKAITNFEAKSVRPELVEGLAHSVRPELVEGLAHGSTSSPRTEPSSPRTEPSSPRTETRL